MHGYSRIFHLHTNWCVMAYCEQITYNICYISMLFVHYLLILPNMVNKNDYTSLTLSLVVRDGHYIDVVNIGTLIAVTILWRSERSQEDPTVYSQMSPITCPYLLIHPVKGPLGYMPLSSQTPPPCLRERRRASCYYYNVLLHWRY